MFYYTRFGGGVKGVFVEVEKTSDFFVGETVLSYAYKFTIPVLDGMVDFHPFRIQLLSGDPPTVLWR